MIFFTTQIGWTCPRAAKFCGTVGSYNRNKPFPVIPKGENKVIEEI